MPVFETRNVSVNLLTNDIFTRIVIIVIIIVAVVVVVEDLTVFCNCFFFYCWCTFCCRCYLAMYYSYLLQALRLTRMGNLAKMESIDAGSKTNWLTGNVTAI